jgi:hypothetical protein
VIWPLRAREHTEVPDVDVDREGARTAREEAEQHLEQVRARSREVRNAAKALHDIRMRNHLAEVVSRALGEKRG